MSANHFPQHFTEIQKIYFIAEDATGPFRKVVQLALTDGSILSFESKRDCQRLINWLSMVAPQVASEIGTLLDDPDERNVEMLIFDQNDQANP